MNKFMKKKYLFTLLFIPLLFLTACGNDNESGNNDATENTSEKTSEITVDSQMGDVTLPANPKSVLAPFHEDTLLALGVTPAAKWAIDKSVQDYLEKDLQDIDSIEWTMPLEQVLHHDPDLIILENSLDSYEGSYEEYSTIAPTYVMKKETTEDWKKQLQVFGEILGKEAEAKQALDDYEAKVKQANKKLQEKLGDDTIAMMWVTGGKYFLFEKNRYTANMIYSELGVDVPSLVKDLGKAKDAWDPISLEKLSELDADHVIILGNKDDKGIETLNNSSVWKNTPAVQNDQVYYLEDESNWTNNGLIASEQTIDQLMELFK
ncbi:iron-hydroxamate ABC transporter substrate-binding protein [Lentibacillus sp. N15]|uniref:iron-hydroxamate ABC transporter substrate-binding protein n=1 Tax=Lentibacillus songyuanensis TaxID=3136161 RepID=UPI0031BAC3A1